MIDVQQDLRHSRLVGPELWRKSPFLLPLLYHVLVSELHVQYVWGEKQNPPPPPPRLISVFE